MSPTCGSGAFGLSGSNRSAPFIGVALAIARVAFGQPASTGHRRNSAGVMTQGTPPGPASVSDGAARNEELIFGGKKLFRARKEALALRAHAAGAEWARSSPGRGSGDDDEVARTATAESRRAPAPAAPGMICGRGTSADVCYAYYGVL